MDASFKAIEAWHQWRGVAALLGEQHHQWDRCAGRSDSALSKGGRIVNGQGADTDIVVASAKAYINALNKLHSKPGARESTALMCAGAEALTIALLQEPQFSVQLDA